MIVAVYISYLHPYDLSCSYCLFPREAKPVAAPSSRRRRGRTTGVCQNAAGANFPGARRGRRANPARRAQRRSAFEIRRPSPLIPLLRKACSLYFDGRSHAAAIENEAPDRVAPQNVLC
jgi:hypothetical protein